MFQIIVGLRKVRGIVGRMSKLEGFPHPSEKKSVTLSVLKNLFFGRKSTNNGKFAKIALSTT
jgi:hypothetical protein